MTPLSAKEQLLLACLLVLFLTGAVVLAVQEKNLDRELSGVGTRASVDQRSGEVSPKKSSMKVDSLVSLSSASVQELDRLPGIGPRLAEEIVRYRSSHPFRSIEDVLKVPGIGPKKFARMKSRVKVE